MDSTYLVAGVAIALLAIVFAWYEVARLKKEIARHKSAAINYRAFVVTQKYALATAVVKRLNLNDAEFPPVNVATYNRVSDLYDQPEFMPYRLPITATGRYDMHWTRTDFADRELFTLWLEGIIDHVPN